jgi:DnaJ-class molecular chaperone
MSNEHVHPLFASILDGFMPPGARSTQCHDCGYTYGTHSPACVSQEQACPTCNGVGGGITRDGIEIECSKCDGTGRA